MVGRWVEKCKKAFAMKRVAPVPPATSITSDESRRRWVLSLSLWFFSFFLDLGILIFFVYIYLGEYVVSTNELAYSITFLE
jgi:hypothetical protein